MQNTAFISWAASYCPDVMVFMGFMAFILPPSRREDDHISAMEDDFPRCNRVVACNVPQLHQHNS